MGKPNIPGAGHMPMNNLRGPSGPSTRTSTVSPTTYMRSRQPSKPAASATAPQSTSPNGNDRRVRSGKVPSRARSNSPDIMEMDDNLGSKQLAKGAASKTPHYLIPGPTKRAVPQPEAIEDEDDELAEMGPPPKKYSKTPNGARTVPAPRQRPPSAEKERHKRADMKKTDFKPQDAAATRLCARITRAYSGDYWYSSQDQPLEKQIHLKSSGGGRLLVPWSDQQPEGAQQSREMSGYLNERQWMAFDTATVWKVTWGPGSRIVILHRSVDGKNICLAFEVEGFNEAESLFRWIKAHQKESPLSTAAGDVTAQKQSDSFERGFAKAFSQKTPASDIRYLEYQAKRAERAKELLEGQKPQANAPRQRLKDAMQTEKSAPCVFESIENERSGAGVTRRRTRGDTGNTDLSKVIRPVRRPPVHESPVVRWVDEHPTWREEWGDDTSLAHPPTGRIRALVSPEDIPKLEEGEFFNDSLVEFYVRHLQFGLSPEAAKKFYFVNPWFYHKLSTERSQSKRFDTALKWFDKIDLFSYDFIIVPVNENLHWYLAIVCYPRKLIESIQDKMDLDEPKPKADNKDKTAAATAAAAAAAAGCSNPKMPGTWCSEDGIEDDAVTSDIQPQTQTKSTTRSSKTYSKARPAAEEKSALFHRDDPAAPRVITFDSLGGTHSATATTLQSFLLQLAKRKLDLDIEPIRPFGKTAKGIPAQEDYSSCGAYLVSYVENFLENPEGAIKAVCERQELGWRIDPSSTRSQVRDLILKLRREQNQRTAQELADKRKAKAAAKNKGTGTATSSPAADQRRSPGTNDPPDADGREEADGFEEDDDEAPGSDNPNHSAPPTPFQATRHEVEPAQKIPPSPGVVKPLQAPNVESEPVSITLDSGDEMQVEGVEKLKQSTNKRQEDVVSPRETSSVSVLPGVRECVSLADSVEISEDASGSAKLDDLPKPLTHVEAQFRPMTPENKQPADQEHPQRAASNQEDGSQSSVTLSDGGSPAPAGCSSAEQTQRKSSVEVARECVKIPDDSDDSPVREQVAGANSVSIRKSPGIGYLRLSTSSSGAAETEQRVPRRNERDVMDITANTATKPGIEYGGTLKRGETRPVKPDSVHSRSNSEASRKTGPRSSIEVVLYDRPQDAALRGTQINSAPSRNRKTIDLTDA